MKTSKSVAKRFKISAGGKVKRSHAFKSHILTKKPSKRKRRLRHADVCSPGDARRMKRLLLKG
jgi:large subunit ribosomal protein L35